MTRGTKSFLMALSAGLVAWVVGVWSIGVASVRYFTGAGTVNMTDASSVARAISDPSFTATVSWGSFTLSGTYWTFTFPLLLGLLAFVLVLALRIAFKPRAQ